GILIFTLGVVIFNAGPDLSRNKSLFFMCVGLSIWLFCYGINYIYPEHAVLNIALSKVSYLGVTMIPLMYLRFVTIFLHLENRKLVFFADIIGTIFIMTALFTNLIVLRNYSFFWGPYPVAGVLHPVYVFFVVSVFIYCLVMQFSAAYGARQKNFSRTDVNRIRYVFFAFLLGNLGSIDFLQNYGFEFYPFGAVNIAGFVIIITYAIVKHRLWDIEVIIKRTLVFGGLIAALYAVFILCVYSGALFFDNFLRNIWIAGVPAVFAVILLHRPVENALRGATDRFLFHKKYDYKKLLSAFSSEVLSVVKIEELLKLSSLKLVTIIKLRYAGILLYDSEYNIFKGVLYNGMEFTEQCIYMPDSAKIRDFFRERANPILIAGGEQNRHPKEIRQIMSQTTAARLVMPLKYRDSLVGILSLGAKKSDEDFTEDDIGILLPICESLAIAIANAELIKKLTEANARAAQNEKMAVIGLLSAGINHEICNPLGIARGKCESFLSNARDGFYRDEDPEALIRKAENILESVIAETDRAAAITKKLSSFARPATGEVIDNVDINSELDVVLGLLQSGFNMTDRIMIRKEIAPDLPVLSADSKEIQEIFFNLIRNAVQAIQGNGEILIRIWNGQGRLNIEIKDTGMGISRKNREQLFSPFFTTKEPENGTGLGLFVVKQIVEKNNGSIEIISTEGEGTLCRIVFAVHAGKE
ncbi:MAG: ATP-binding protein, partial [Candidatus Omnitrophota bacterium]